MNLTIITLLTLIFAIGMPLSTIFHLLRMKKNNSSEGQSYGYPIILLIGSILWLSYGIQNNDIVLIIANVLWFVMNSLYLLFVRIYRH